MFASFLLPSVFEGERTPHLLVFYKQLGAFGRGEIAFVGDPAYFRPPATLAAEGRHEWTPALRTQYEFDPPDDLAGVLYEGLPEHLFSKHHARGRSGLAVHGLLMQRRVHAFEVALDRALDRLERHSKLEGLVSLVNMPSLKIVAKRRGLPLIQCEYGPLRKPTYVMTGYWDRRETSALRDARHRLRRFRRELARERFPLLDTAGLLQLLRREELAEVPAPASARYRLGIALQGDDHGYAQPFRPLDLLSMAHRHFKRDDILIRHHPAALTRCSERLGHVDASPTATEFISQCESILTVSSGAALEALLLGRRPIVIGDSAFALAGERSLDPSRRRRPVNLTALNFLALCYVVPFDLTFDPDYTRWRLTDPPELEIARLHQQWHSTRVGAVPEVGLSPSTAAALLAAVAPAYRSAVVVFGAGARTAALVAHLRSTRFSPAAIFDNDRSKWGTQIADLPVEAPTYRRDAAVIVSSHSYAEEMVGQLLALGYRDDRIVRLEPAA